MNHIQDQNKFEIKTGEHTSELTYNLDSVNKLMEVYRTYVPDALRGQGVAARLNKAALAFAEENQFKVVPVCSYTAGYIAKHPEFEHLLKK